MLPSPRGAVMETERDFLAPLRIDIVYGILLLTKTFTQQHK